MGVLLGLQQNSSKSCAPSRAPLSLKESPLLNKTSLRAMGCPSSQDPWHCCCLSSHTCKWRGRDARSAEPSDAAAGRGEVAGHKALGPFISPIFGRNLERFHEKEGKGHKTNKNPSAWPCPSPKLLF